jgi:hypothetical protein
MKSARLNASDRKQSHLRIGDQWNAITILALSQNNPLKAVAEFVKTASTRRPGTSSSRGARIRARISSNQG